MQRDLVVVILYDSIYNQYIYYYLSGLLTAVAVFRNPNTIPFCLATDLLLNVLFSWLLVQLPSTFFLDVLFFLLSPGIHSIINFGSLSSYIHNQYKIVKI